MSDKIIEYRLPCPFPNCNSSDAYHIWEDGHGHCFSCKQTKPSDKMTDTDDQEYTYQYINHRGISADTLRFYGVEAKVNSEGAPVATLWPHPNGSFKIRRLDVPKERSFLLVGDDDARKEPQLFGRDKFSAGSAKAITITEGYEDAAAAYQMLGSRYPVVSVRSSSTAKADCTAERKYLDSFEKIYLCFDNDEVGKKAKAEVASLFDFNKVYDVQLDLKDANEYLQENRDQEYRNIWYNSRRFLPEGIISSFAEIDQIIESDSSQAIASYPYSELNNLLDGIHEGQFIVLTAQEKVGKTEIIRAFEYHILKTTDYNIGVIHLEEPKKRTVQGFAGLELGLPLHVSDVKVSIEDVKDAYRRAVGRDDRVHIYSHFGSDDPDVILDLIRFLVSSCGCKFVFLDHITMVVSGLMDDDERKALDYITTQLKMMCINLKFTCIAINHVNDDGRPRGSRNVNKVCDVRIHMDRDMLAASPVERNTTTLSVYLNRGGYGLTGPAGRLYFDPRSFTLRELTKVDEALPIQQ